MYIVINIMFIIYITTSIAIKLESYVHKQNIFQTFLNNYLNLLFDGCSGKQLKNHCRIMYKELDKVGYIYTKQLAKIYKELSSLPTDLIHDEIKGYLKELDRTTNRRTEFFTALNEAFHPRESILFNNYVNDLSDYCNQEKMFIHEESHKLLHEAILYAIEKLSYKKQRALGKKLKTALKEYSEIDLFEKLKLYNIPLPTRWHMAFPENTTIDTTSD